MPNTTCIDYRQWFLFLPEVGQRWSTLVVNSLPLHLALHSGLILDPSPIFGFSIMSTHYTQVMSLDIDLGSSVMFNLFIYYNRQWSTISNRLFCDDHLVIYNWNLWSDMLFNDSTIWCVEQIIQALDHSNTLSFDHLTIRSLDHVEDDCCHVIRSWTLVISFQAA